MQFQAMSFDHGEIPGDVVSHSEGVDGAVRAKALGMDGPDPGSGSETPLAEIGVYDDGMRAQLSLTEFGFEFLEGHVCFSLEFRPLLRLICQSAAGKILGEVN